MALFGKKHWKKYGALDYMECVGDDLKPQGGSFGFGKLARLRAGETVVFSYITYRSKAHRNQVNDRVMKDPSMNNFDPKAMPMDLKRMAMGGFKVIVGTR